MEIFAHVLNSLEYQVTQLEVRLPQQQWNTVGYMACNFDEPSFQVAMCTTFLLCKIPHYGSMENLEQPQWQNFCEMD